VCRTGARPLGRGLHVPRSTISSWKRRGLRFVVSLDVFGDRPQLLSTIDRLEKRARILAATVRLLLALLRASGFSFVGKRLPEGKDKASILRAIASAVPSLPLSGIAGGALLHLAARRQSMRPRRSLPVSRTKPAQITAAEIAVVKDMVLARSSVTYPCVP